MQQTVLEMSETQDGSSVCSALKSLPSKSVASADIALAFEALNGQADALYVVVDQLVVANLMRILTFSARCATADDLQHARFCSIRWVHVVRTKLLGYVPALGRLRG